MIHLLFRFERTQAMPWQKLFICALTSTLPLAVGHILHQRDQAILASLFGLALTLNDHPAEKSSRVLHLCHAAFFLISSYIVGSLLANSPLLFFASLALCSFLLGKIKGKGIELERIFLFALLNMITVAGLKMPMRDVLIGATYSFVNFLFYLFLFLCFSWIHAHEKNKVQKRQILKKAFGEKRSTVFGMKLMLMAIASYLLGQKLNLAREYWIAGTIIIVMIPDPTGTYVRAIQRFLGTLGGMLILFLLLPILKISIFFYLAFIFITTLLIPLTMNLNFFAGNVLITAYIMALIELSLPAGVNLPELAILRAGDIFAGGLIVCIGTCLIEFFYARTKRQPAL